MPRADHYPPDIMDRYAAFISAVNELKAQLEDWERRYNPNQPRIPAGQPGGGRWGNGGSGIQDLAGAARRVSKLLGRPHPDAAATRSVLKLPPGPPGRQYGVPRDKEINPPDDMRKGVPYVQARSRKRLNKLLGKPEPGMQRDHVTERSQMPYFTDRPQNDPRVVDNSSNVMDLPRKVHECKSSEYSKKMRGAGVTVRMWLRGKPIAEQYEYGLKTIAECYLKEEKKKEELSRSPIPAEADRSVPVTPPLPVVPNLGPSLGRSVPTPAPGGGGPRGPVGGGGALRPFNPKLPSLPGFQRLDQLFG